MCGLPGVRFPWDYIDLLVKKPMVIPQIGGQFKSSFYVLCHKCLSKDLVQAREIKIASEFYVTRRSKSSFVLLLCTWSSTMYRIYILSFNLQHQPYELNPIIISVLPEKGRQWTWILISDFKAHALIIDLAPGVGGGMQRKWNPLFLLSSSVY